MRLCVLIFVTLLFVWFFLGLTYKASMSDLFALSECTLLSPAV